MRARAISTIVVALAVGALVAGCGGGSGTSSSNASNSTADSGTPQRGGNLIFARTSDIVTFDRTQDFDNESTWVSDLMFETLYKPSRDGHTDLPWLATSYEVSPDKLTWTFHLRPGVKFSNGKPMTSADVKFSLDTTRAKSSGWSFIDTAIENISTPDPETVVIKTTKPWAPLLSDMAIFPNGIIPNNYGGKTKAQFLQHPIGTGPFMLGQWTKGQQLKLVRNPYYWQKGKPYLDSVTFTAVPDDTTRINQLKGQAADIIEFPPFSSIQQLSTTPNVTVKEFPGDRVDTLLMNNSKAPLNDPHVRRAINLSIDRQAMVKALLFGYGKPANSYLPPQLAFYDANATGDKYDPAAAKAELAQSKYPHGFNIALQVVGGNTAQQQMAQIVQQELKPLGINVKIQLQDQNAEATAVQTGNYTFAYQYYTSDVVDADELVPVLNIFAEHYNNPEFNKLANQAASTFDKPTRVKLYNQIQDLVNSDAAVTLLWFQPLVYAYSNRVHGFLAAPTGDYELQDVWLSQ
jgi:peptide/nickel transport system substrate-binding protein